jgi:hypothetical protein
VSSTPGWPGQAHHIDREIDSTMHAFGQRTQRGRRVQDSTQQHRRLPVKRCLTCCRSTKSMMANGFGRDYHLKPHRTSAASVFWCSHPRRDVTAVARHLHRSSPLLRPRRSLTLAKTNVDAHSGVIEPATRSQRLL